MPLLSIVVPTHERARYAIPTLRGLLDMTGTDVEIIISDTSEVDEITPALQSHPEWHRAQMVRPGHRLSVIDNFNSGVARAQGDYLLFLGDDDFINPELINVVQWAQSEEIEALTFSFPALYFWPDFVHKRRHDFYAGSVQVQSFTGKVAAYSAKDALRKAARDLGGGVGQMPRAYAGIVSRQLVQRVIAQHGPLFGGVSPDIYSAALLAHEVQTCVCIDYPLVVPGSSGASTAGLSASGQHVGQLRDNAHISAFSNLVWNPLVPEFYSVPTVWGFTLLEALSRLSSEVGSHHGRLYARCLFYHRTYWLHTRTSLLAWQNQVGTGRALISLAQGFGAELGWIARKLYSLSLKRAFPGLTTTLRGQSDSFVAANTLAAWLAVNAPRLELPNQVNAGAVHPTSEPSARPLLSIVLPSCNRQMYLRRVLATLLEETQAEVVVCDNSDQALEPAELDALSATKRVVYRFIPERLSVVDNFERGLAMATGEYILFLGDDDCVGPGIEALVRWAKSHRIEALISYENRFIANYFWPGVKSKYFDDGYAGKLFLNRFTSRARWLDARRETFRASRNPGAGLGAMPRAYHGIVSRSLVQRILVRHGRLFGGVSPDIYSATLISQEVRTAIAVDYPFVIPGGSAPSTAGEGAARSDVGQLDAREHIKRFGPDLVWDARIPSFYSPTTVWAYSQQMGLKALGSEGYDINYPRLYLKCLLTYPKHRASTWAAMQHWLNGRSALRVLPGMIWGAAMDVRQVLSRVWYRFVMRPISFTSLEEIGDAYRKLEQRVPAWVPPSDRL